MGLLDFEDTYVAPFKPRKDEREPTEEERATLLNNHNRREVTEDFGDSPHADRK